MITLKGNSMVNNLTATILYNSSIQQLIANNEEEYIHIACNQHEKGKRSKESRLRLREKTINSNLGNTKRLVGELERIYREEANI